MNITLIAVSLVTAVVTIGLLLALLSRSRPPAPSRGRYSLISGEHRPARLSIRPLRYSDRRLRRGTRLWIFGGLERWRLSLLRVRLGFSELAKAQAREGEGTMKHADRPFNDDDKRSSTTRRSEEV